MWQQSTKLGIDEGNDKAQHCTYVGIKECNGKTQHPTYEFVNIGEKFKPQEFDQVLP